jgi:hypothetical protein
MLCASLQLCYHCYCCLSLNMLSSEKNMSVLTKCIGIVSKQYTGRLIALNALQSNRHPTNTLEPAV